MIDSPVGTFVILDNHYQPGCQLCSLKVAPTWYSDDGRYIDMHCKVTFLSNPCEATAAPEILGDPE